MVQTDDGLQFQPLGDGLRVYRGGGFDFEARGARGLPHPQRVEVPKLRVSACPLQGLTASRLITT